MILLVDIGNSRIKAAQWRDGEIVHCTACAHRRRFSQAMLDQCWGDLPVPAQVWIANVAGAQAAAVVEQWIEAHWGCAVHFVCTRARQLGVSNAYLQPDRLGVDRWMGLIACRQTERVPAIIVNCGTALTIDVIDAEGRHLGGYLAPGLKTQRDSLCTSTEIVLRDTGGEPLLELACDTEKAIIRGTLYSIVSLINQSANQLTKKYSVDFSRVITGGEAPAIIPFLEGDWLHQPALVLAGIGHVMQSA